VPRYPRARAKSLLRCHRIAKMTGLTHSDKQRCLDCEGATEAGVWTSRTGVEGVSGSKRMDPDCLLCTMCSVRPDGPVIRTGGLAPCLNSVASAAEKFGRAVT
jgi:hypothetical protein